MITYSAPVIKKKNSLCLSQSPFSNFAPVCRKCRKCKRILYDTVRTLCKSVSAKLLTMKLREMKRTSASSQIFFFWQEEKVKIDKEEAKHQAQKRKEAIERAKTLQYYQTDRVKTFHVRNVICQMLQKNLLYNIIETQIHWASIQTYE